MHLVVDALGLPVAFKVTEGQSADCSEAIDLTRQAGVTCLLADKGYDTDAIRRDLAERDCEVVIPSKSSRSQRITYDSEKYKARSEVECTFNLLKQARRFATRYEKTLRNYAAVVTIGCIMLWLRI